MDGKKQTNGLSWLFLESSSFEKFVEKEVFYVGLACKMTWNPTFNKSIHAQIIFPGYWKKLDFNILEASLLL